MLPVSCVLAKERAKVSLVSCAPMNERAKAVAVSLRREKVRPARPGVCVSAKKFALRAENTLISAFLGLLGEFFRGRAGGAAALGEFFHARAVGSPVLGEFFRANRHCARSCKRRAPSILAVVGVLHDTRQSHSVSPACRTLMSCNSPAGCRWGRDSRWCGAQSADRLGERC